jgi:hypothetical protein
MSAEKKLRDWTIVVDEIVATREQAERLRELLVNALLEVGQRPRTTTVESWLYRENTERVYNEERGVEEVRVSTFPHRLLPKAGLVGDGLSLRFGTVAGCRC